MNKLVGIAITLAALGAVVACSDSSDKDGSNPDPGTGDGGGGGSGDGGGGGGGGQDAGDPGTKGKFGTVSLTQAVISAGGKDLISSTASASFFEGSAGVPSGANTSCTQSKEGACSVTECDVGPTPDGGAEADAGVTKDPHAGEITVNGAIELKLTPDANGKYVSATQQARLWDDGAAILVKAAGADVPAFDKSVQGPSTVTVTAPVWPAAGAPVEVDRATDLALGWSGGVAGNVQAVLSSTSEDHKKFATVSCVYPANAGAGTVPKAALGKLIAGDNATISLHGGSVDEVTTGDWKVSIVALAPATTSDGAVAQALAKIK